MWWDEFIVLLSAGGLFWLIPCAFFVVSLVTFFWSAVRVVKRKLRKGQQALSSGSESLVRTSQTVPVLGYKTAKLVGVTLDDSEGIVDMRLSGLLGFEYGVKDSTTKRGYKKFNMYSDVSAALGHEQDWGDVFLEVVGSGEVEEHELGYTAQHQRVLQVAFLECSRYVTHDVKCNNKPEYLALADPAHDKGARSGLHKAYCSGCKDWFKDVRLLASYYNQSFTLLNGHVLVVAGKSTRRERVDFVPTVIEGSVDNGHDRDDCDYGSAVVSRSYPLAVSGEAGETVSSEDDGVSQNKSGRGAVREYE